MTMRLPKEVLFVRHFSDSGDGFQTLADATLFTTPAIPVTSVERIQVALADS
jgi:hypothetical protein